MAIVVRDFEQMVSDTLARIINTTSITNINSGSVIRTIVESILAETDVQYYQISQLFNAMGLDTAVNSDLDRLVAILGVIRKPATPAVGIQTFGRANPYGTDIPIPQGSIISTLPDRSGNIIEFYVSDADAVLPAGQTSVDVYVTSNIDGEIFVPSGALSIMNNPILNIAYTVNNDDIYGGTNAESDDDLRNRANEALESLGRGTIGAIQTAVKNIAGVNDAIVLDMPRGPGTVDVITVTATIPPDPPLIIEIEDAIRETKSAGIMIDIIYPTINNIDVTVTTTKFIDNVAIFNAIIGYMSSLQISNDFIINQMERAVLNAAAGAGYPDADITTILPASNVEPGGTEIIRAGTITVNGEVMN